MCETPSYQYRVNNRVFWNRDIDIDLQPQNYAKLDHVDESFHPPLYYMWYCPQCHFTSGYKHFIHPLKDVYVKVDAVAERISSAYENDEAFRKIVKTLSAGIDVEGANFFQGLRLHLLAIVELELIEDMVKQYFLNLGRYCLHLAWLYRDLEGRPDVAAETQPRMDELYLQLRDVWPEMPRTELDALNKAAAYYDQTYERSPQVKTVIDEVSLLQVIARIYIKIKRQVEARKLIETSIARAGEAKKVIDDKLRENKDMSSDASGDLVSLSRQLRAVADEGKKLLQTLTDREIKEQFDQARDLIAIHKAKGKNKEELQRILLNNHIDRRIVRKLLPSDPKKKKGRFW